MLYQTVLSDAEYTAEREARHPDASREIGRIAL